MMYLLRKSGKCVHFPAERINAFPTMLYDRLLDKPEFIELFSLVVIASPEGAWQSKNQVLQIDSHASVPTGSE